jgi:hypothetical protein
LLSFRLTSALLSGFVQSRLMIFVTFGATLVIAVVMPFLMIEAVTYLWSLVALNAVGTLSAQNTCQFNHSNTLRTRNKRRPGSDNDS